MNEKTKTVYVAGQSSGKFVQYGNGVEFHTDWGNGTVFATQDEARAEYERLVEGLPADWRCEYNCSNRRFAGGFGAKLEREVWELDEDGELYDLLECETLDMKVWDGEGWFE